MTAIFSKRSPMINLPVSLVWSSTRCVARTDSGPVALARQPPSSGAAPRTNASAFAREPREERTDARPAFRERTGHRVEVAVVHVAPAPALAALERGDHRMAGGEVVRERVRVLRVLAAADVSAGEAHAQGDPGRLADRLASFAARGASV